MGFLSESARNPSVVLSLLSQAWFEVRFRKRTHSRLSDSSLLQRLKMKELTDIQRLMKRSTPWNRLIIPFITYTYTYWYVPALKININTTCKTSIPLKHIYTLKVSFPQSEFHHPGDGPPSATCREKRWPRYFGRESRVCYLKPISAVLMVKVYMVQHRDCFIEFIGESLPRISSFLFFDVFRNVEGICWLYLVDPSLWISLELMLTIVDIPATKWQVHTNHYDAVAHLKPGAWKCCPAMRPFHLTFKWVLLILLCTFSQRRSPVFRSEVAASCAR